MIAFVVVEYKNAKKTISYIKHLNEKVNEHTVVAIVDNSEDVTNTEEIANAFQFVSAHEVDDYEYLRLKFDKLDILLFEMNENLGYARGNNWGIEKLRKIMDLEFVIVSNNDIRIENEFLDLNVFRNIFRKYDRVAVIGPYIIGNDGKKQSPCKKVSFMKRWIVPNILYPVDRLLGKDVFTDLIQNASTGDVYRVQGSFMAIDLEAFSTVGGFDDNTFLYCEESILAEKLAKIEKGMYYTDEIKLLHDHDQTIGNFYKLEDKLKLRYKSESYYYKQYLNLSTAEEFIGNISLRFYLTKLRLIKGIRKWKT